MALNEFYPNPHQPLLVVISGPSGVGKDSVLMEMKQRKLPPKSQVKSRSAS